MEKSQPAPCLFWLMIPYLQQEGGCHSPLSPQSVFQELATSQYGVPFSIPQPRMRMAWPPIISPATCLYTPEEGKPVQTKSRPLSCSHSTPVQLATPAAETGLPARPWVHQQNTKG